MPDKAQRGRRRSRKSRPRVSPGWDEYGQYIDPYHPTRLGDCFLCGRTAYRQDRVKLDGRWREGVLTCNREHTRVTRSRGATFSNLRRKLKDVDVQLGYKLARDGMPAVDIADRVNAARRKRGEGEVVYTQIIRRCVPSSRAFKGPFKQGE